MHASACFYCIYGNNIAALLDHGEQFAGLYSGVLGCKQLVYAACHARYHRGLHLHRLDDQQHLILLDHVALLDQYARYHARQTRRHQSCPVCQT